MDEQFSIEMARQKFLVKYNINTNFIEDSKFLFVTHNLPYLNFFVQSFVLPSVSTSPAYQETPLSTIRRAGDKMQFEELAVTFLVDEDLRVYEEVFNWLKGITFPHQFKEYKEQKDKGIYADCSVLFLKNSYESNLSFRFHNMFPTSIGPINFTSGTDGSQVLTTDITFSYDTFRIVRGAQ